MSLYFVSLFAYLAKKDDLDSSGVERQYPPDMLTVLIHSEHKNKSNLAK